MKLANKLPRFLIMIFSIILITACAQQGPKKSDDSKFMVIPLGTKGGTIEGNLSSYLVAPSGDSRFLALDAGTLYAGLKQAEQNGSLTGIDLSADTSSTPEVIVMRDRIKAYAISHAHLDHVAGLVINSPNDTAKPVMGLTSTIDNIRDHLFNWKVWPNFGNEGVGFHLNKYQYLRLTADQKYPVRNTKMTITPYRLSHSGGYISTAFLIESKGDALLYFGDTGADAVEKSENMQHVWASVAPLISDHKLHAIFLECSFPDGLPDKFLFGHLTPAWMMSELRALAEIVNPNQPEVALKGLKVVVTHVKQSLRRNVLPEKKIMKELSELNDLGIEFILPESGRRLDL